MYDFVYEDMKAGVALCSISGGTDIVSCFVLGSPLLPVWRGEIHTDEFALLADYGTALIFPDLDRHAEAFGLDLAAPDRKQRRTKNEAGDNVCAAGDRAERHAGFHVFIDEIETLRHERRTGGENHAHGRQVMRLARLEAGLLYRVDEFCRCTISSMKT